MTTKTAPEHASDAAAPTLAERLRRAREAEVAPCQRAAELETALTAAIDRRDFAEAARLEAELIPAREAAGFARAVSGALAEQVAAIETERQSRQAAREKAEQMAGAQEVVGEAMADERQAAARVGECVAQFWALLAAAQREYRQAQEWETRGGQATRRRLQARVLAGEAEGMPRYISTPNAASVLQDEHVLVRELLKWRP